MKIDKKLVCEIHHVEIPAHQLPLDLLLELETSWQKEFGADHEYAIPLEDIKAKMKPSVIHRIQAMLKRITGKVLTRETR